MLVKKNFLKIILIILGVAATSFYGGYMLTDYEYKKFIFSFKSIRQEPDLLFDKDLTRPLLGTDSDDATTIGVYKDLKNSLQKFANQAVSRGVVNDYGIYFRSLTYPLWFGLNEDEYYLPASLQKLPIAMSVYKDIEYGHLSREKKLVFTEEVAKKTKVDPLYLPTKLVVGKTYSVDELIRSLIIESDNGAKDLLVTSVSEKTLLDTFRLVNFTDVINFNEVSPKVYSFYFRILYNATYISKENSNELLSLLVSSSYKNALMSKIPPDMKVAHKYGLYNDSQNNFYSLHDCGVFYVKEDPYILCVMTKGRNVEDLENFIGNISEKVFEYQSTR